MGEEYILADLVVLLLMHKRMRLNGWSGCTGLGRDTLCLGSRAGHPNLG